MTITPTFSTISVTIQPPPEPKKKSRFKKKKNAVGSASNMNSTPFINLVEEPNYESFLVQSLPVDPTVKNKPIDNNNLQKPPPTGAFSGEGTVSNGILQYEKV